MNHTPGPWRHGHEHSHSWVRLDQADTEEGQFVIIYHENHRSNARLIAAAPDLYAALRRLVDGINDEWHPLFNSPGPMSDDEREALERAEAAITKAEELYKETK